MHDLYDYLRSYGLARKGSIANRLAKFSERKLTKFLESYLDVARKRPLAMPAQVGSLDIYPDSWADPLPLGMIIQLAIYAGRIYVHDPLLSFALDWPGLDFIPFRMMKHRSREERVSDFCKSLAIAMEKVLELEPLAKHGIIHFTPAELAQPRRDPRAMYWDDLYGPGKEISERIANTKSKLPPSLRAYLDEHLRVLPAMYQNGEPIVLPTETLSPRTFVAVLFEGDPIAHFYHFFSIVAISEQEHTVGGRFDPRGDQIIDSNTFWNWVEGEKYKAATERLERLMNDLNVAGIARARLITNLPATRDMAILNPDSTLDAAAQKAITALLRFELPFFENVDLSAIAKARKNEVAFEEFRVALDRAFNEINALPSSVEFQRQIDQISRDVLLVPMKRMEQQMNALRRDLFLDAGISVGSLIVTLVSQGNTLISAAAATAALKAVEMYRKDKSEEDKLKQLPSFFYWELARDAQKKRA